MLIAFHQISGASLRGTDDLVGSIEDLYFDAESWQVRYLVVDTGKWLPGRKVLLPVEVVTGREWGMHAASVGLTRDQVQTSPDVETQKPVSRQMELALFQHYNVPMYWGPAGAAMAGGAGIVPPTSGDIAPGELPETERSLTSLHSAREVKRYYIRASDGDLGHVEDFIVDDRAWVIRYLAIDTKNWLPARKVLVSPEWIEDISWTETTVKVDLTCEKIKNSPEYDPLQSVNRGYEEHLYDYYGRERYWLPSTVWNPPSDTPRD